MFKKISFLAIFLLFSLQNLSAAAPHPFLPAELIEGIDRIGQNIADRARMRRDQERHRKEQLELDVANFRGAVHRNPNDMHAQRQLALYEARLEEAQEAEQHARERADKMEDMAAGVAKDVAGVFINKANAENDRKKAVAEAVAKQRAANQGALERLQHLTSGDNLKRIGIATGAVGGSLILTYFMAKFGLYYAQKFIGMPKLVRESSEKNLWQSFVSLFSSEEEATNFLQDVVLNAELGAVINDIAKATQETKQDGIPFRNVILYGEPGTGKTMIAKRIARYCGMDYAILSGADFTQFEEGKDIEQLHLLFERAEKSKKGMVIFIDEAEAALRNRKDMDNRGKALVDAFLSHTGDKSAQFMLILATNHPQDLDPAVLSRFSKKIHVALPDLNERAKIIQLYLNKYFVTNPTILDGEQAMLSPELNDKALETIAKELNGWSGRDLEDLVGELRYVLSGQHSRIVTPVILKMAAAEKLKQRKELANYEGHSAAKAAVAA